MRILNNPFVFSGAVYYDIELADDILVNVKILTNSGLAYILQNEDGTTAYSRSQNQTCPDYQYDERQLISIVLADFKKHEGKLKQPQKGDNL
jgi:transcriptional antiterminator